MKGAEPQFYQFKSFRLNVEERQLFRNEKVVPLTPKSFDVLALLVERGGHLVERDELLQTVWADSFVEEANITRTIHTLRKVLGDDGSDDKFIETVAKRGYRFVAGVTKVCLQPDAAKLQTDGEDLKASVKKLVKTESEIAESAFEVSPKAANAVVILPASTNDANKKTEQARRDFPQKNKSRQWLLFFSVPAILIVGFVVLYHNRNFNQFASAQDLYLQGRFYAARENREANDKAIQLLEQAVALDPNHALAHAELARAYGTRYFQLEPQQKRWFEKSYVELEKALALNPDLAEAHEIRGFLLWMPANRFPHEQAIAAYRRATVLNPNLDEPHQQIGKIYLHIGLLEEALTEFRRALELNPGNTMARYRIGIVLIHQGKYEEAERNLKTTPPEINPAIVGRDSVWLLISLGRTEEAGQLIAEMLEKNPTDEGGQLAAFKALMFASAGNAAQAEREIQNALERGQGFGHFHHTAYIIACTYAALGKPEEAVRFLQITADDGYPCYPLFEKDAKLDAVRQNPKFQSFLAVQKRQWEHHKTLAQF